MKKLMIGAAIAAIACGCISVNQNDGGNACRKPLMAKDIVHEKFTVAKNTVSAQDKLYGICFGPFNFTFGSSATHEADAVCSEEKSFFDKIFPNAANKAKNGAYANACDAANCDQIVGAKYKVKTTSYVVFKIFDAEITGYPATLSGVEVIENKAPCCK